MCESNVPRYTPYSHLYQQVVRLDIRCCMFLNLFMTFNYRMLFNEKKIYLQFMYIRFMKIKYYNRTYVFVPEHQKYKSSTKRS